VGIEDVDIPYDKSVPMKEVKRRLLVALVDKYKRTMHYLPFPEFRITEYHGEYRKNAERKFEWTYMQMESRSLLIHSG
jgi:hypothetical protein